MEEKEFWFDSFEVAFGVHGGKLTFNIGSYDPRDTSRKVSAKGYTSTESLKSMAYVLTRAVKQNEKQIDVSYPIPTRVLNEWGIAPEDWDNFWK